MGRVHILKSKVNRYLLAGFFTIFFLTGAILSCSGGNGGDNGGGSGPATVPAVVFIADKDNDGINELYVSLNDGASVLKLSGALTPGGNVTQFKISPDGNRVAYLADQDIDEVFELYVNSINPGTPVKIHPDFTADRDVMVPFGFTFDAFIWSPDSSLIAYIADQLTDERFELFVSTPDGISNFRVSSGAIIADGDVREFEWAPDSSRIAYRAIQDTIGIVELYTVQPTLTATPVKVSDPLMPVNQPGGDVEVPASNEDFFQWAPDSSRIAFLADPDNNDVFELFTTLPTGSGSIFKVSDDLSGDRDVTSFKWAPDSSLIAYRADQDNNDVFELYTATPDAASVNDKVSVTPTDPLGDIWEFEWAPDNSRIAYRAEQDTNLVFELYTSLPGGGDNRLVSAIDPIAVPGSNVINFAWSPDSSLIAYLANQETVTVNELFTSPPDGSGNDKISALDPIAIPGSDVLTYIWASDSSRVAYFADQDTDTILEVYSSLPDGSINDKVSGPLVGGNGKISGPIIPAGDVLSFEYEP
jgi:Tol biopolymer transport system component